MMLVILESKDHPTHTTTFFVSENAKISTKLHDTRASCIKCCYSRRKHGKAEGQMYISEPEPTPFCQIHLDYLYTIVVSKTGNTYVLAMLLVSF